MCRSLKKTTIESFYMPHFDSRMKISVLTDISVNIFI